MDSDSPSIATVGNRSASAIIFCRMARQGSRARRRANTSWALEVGDEGLYGLALQSHRRLAF